MKILFPLLILLSAVSNTHGQQPEKFLLRWNFLDNEYIIYDYSTFEIESDGNDLKDDLKQQMDKDEYRSMKRMLRIKEYEQKELKKFDNVAILNERNNKIQIRVIRKLKAGQSRETNDEHIFSVEEGIIIRGILNKDGSIYSQYLKNDEKNLIALFFQLPADSISIGDSWNLDLQLITMDASFRCDSAYQRNVVSLIGVSEVDGQAIAQLEYDIEDFIKGIQINPLDNAKYDTELHIIYKGIAEFNITKGRWDNYEMLKSSFAKGIRNFNTVSNYKLTERKIDKEIEEILISDL